VPKRVKALSWLDAVVIPSDWVNPMGRLRERLAEACAAAAGATAAGGGGAAVAAAAPKQGAAARRAALADGAADDAGAGALAPSQQPLPLLPPLPALTAGGKELIPATARGARAAMAAATPPHPAAAVAGAISEGERIR
jgi:hypothetical protein